MRPIPVGLIALGAGLIAGFGVGKYEAWWTIAIAIGGAALAIEDWRGHSGGRAVATGAGVTAGFLLVGMALFALAGSLIGGGAPWLAASAAMLVAAIALVFILRRSTSRVA